ncbi:hypothetical protein BKA62DRAFT_615677 [Auriculariales sp. MPI-PUGE-AT-0066]|nr:hypothetical protein BKA62DRAFT_615677 [Auriculariales sp. MPI-PUGE-AT-0066]
MAGQQPGVSRIEAFSRVVQKNSWIFWTFVGFYTASVLASGLDGTTTYSFEAIAAAGYGEHGQLLGTIAIVTSILRGVATPLTAKICDISSRQTALSIGLACYVLGYVLTAASTTADAFAAGRVLSTMGNTALEFVSGLIVADLTPLRWRAAVTALLSVPWIWFSFAGPYISGPLIDRPDGWRWGYGIFCITPVTVIPVIVFLFLADKKAIAVGELDLSESPYARRYKQLHDGQLPQETIFGVLSRAFVEIDTIGLFLLAASFCLLLVPFSIAASQVEGWHTPFIIAMLTLGGVLLFVFFLYEIKFASEPIMTKRIFFNKTFVLAMIIDTCYFLGGYLTLVYYSSYIYVLKDWTSSGWATFNNELTVALWFISGLLMRVTHRYKIIQTVGLCIRTVGLGVTYYARGKNGSTAALVLATMLVGMGGSCSVMGTQVATQASVAHQDLASIKALLSLWTTFGGAIGSAIVSAVWTNRMPLNLLKEGVPEDQIAAAYGGFALLHSYPLEDPIRQAAIRAADRTLEPMYIASIFISIIAIGAGVMMPNYVLGRSHNLIDKTDTAGRKLTQEEIEAETAPVRDTSTRWGRFKSFMF